MVKEAYKMTELGEIPVEWEVKRLDSIIKKFIVPMRDKPKIFDGTIPWCRIEDIEGKFLNGTKSNQFVSWKTIDEMNLKIHPKGTVICSCSASLGINAITTKDLITNQTFIGLVSESNADEEYLYYCMKWNTNRLKKIASGTTIPYISREKFEKFKVLVPPLKEQNKIAVILSIVDEYLDQTDKLIKKTKELKKGLMQKLLTKGIGNTEFKKSEVGDIPVEWEVKKLSELVVKITDGTHKTPRYTDEGIPFLRVTDIQKKEIDWQNTKFISQEEHLELIKRCNPEIGDILYSKNGTIGVPKIIDWDKTFSIFVSLCLIKVKKDNSKINNKFLSMILESEMIKKQIRWRAKQGTVTNLHLEEIRDFLIVVPQLEEQKQIADILSSINEKNDQYENKKEKLQELKKGLMQQLLTGKVRVKV